MIFKQTRLSGVYIIELEPIKDIRGYFARGFCKKDFKRHGIDFDIVQCSVSYNRKKGTLRGMHFQASPRREAKLVTCIQGRIYDAVVDLRRSSKTYGKWVSVELDAKDAKTLYVPEGLAHGFQTLRNDTVISYQMSEYFYPESARGIRWDDPFFNIKWPLKKIVISEKDKRYPLFKRI